MLFPDTDATAGMPEITRDEVGKALQSFSAGSGAGPDGLRPQHLKDLAGIQGETGQHFLTALCKLSNRIIGGVIPIQVSSVLFSANLTPLLKNNPTYCVRIRF